MRLGGRAQAAIEVLAEWERGRRPVAQCLADWGRSHRFAGGGDRAAIGNLVYDALRRRLSTAHAMGADDPRSLVLGVLLREWGHAPQGLREAFAGDRHAPELPDDLALADSEPAHHVRADLPEWVAPFFEGNFADDWVAEGVALAARPPLDLRANTLKATPAKVAKALRASPGPTPIALHGLRVPPGEGPARLPNVTADQAHAKGWFEVQDEGSQVVAELVYAQPGEQVMDFCAGSGGKTLALAAAMENRGQIHAYDADRQRLRPIHERLRRAGARNVQVHEPGGEGGADLSALVGRMDRVLVDAPCTGSGTWRRHPDTKWKLTSEALERRVEEQDEVLAQAAPFVRPGGYLTYVTCSVLPVENEARVAAFLEDNASFELLSAGEVWQDLYGFEKPQPWSADMMSVTLTPASTGTDGFFFAVMGSRDG